MKRIVLGTRNPDKVREIRQMLATLSLNLEPLPGGAPVVEETATTFRGNAELKAGALARHLGVWVLADDSGLEVDALGGFPGTRSHRWAGDPPDDQANNRKLAVAMAGVPETKRTARYRCAMALASPQGVAQVGEGTCEGRIQLPPRGDGGFGYDPLFFSNDLGKTFAEAFPEEKHRVSHRGRALAALLPDLERI